MKAAVDRTHRELAYHGTPWEQDYGYAQAVRVKDTIRVAGQVSHDAEGNFVGAPSPEDDEAATLAKMELQMRTTYANAAKILARFGADLEDVVEEVLYVTDMEAAFAVAGTVRKAAYRTNAPRCASTIVEVTRLALPQQLIEISFTAVVPD